MLNKIINSPRLYVFSNNTRISIKNKNELRAGQMDASGNLVVRQKSSGNSILPFTSSFPSMKTSLLKAQGKKTGTLKALFFSFTVVDRDGGSERCCSRSRVMQQQQHMQGTKSKPNAESWANRRPGSTSLAVDVLSFSPLRLLKPLWFRLWSLKDGRVGSSPGQVAWRIGSGQGAWRRMGCLIRRSLQ